MSSLVDSVFHSLDDAVLPSANWVLILSDLRGEIRIYWHSITQRIQSVTDQQKMKNRMGIKALL